MIHRLAILFWLINCATSAILQDREIRRQPTKENYQFDEDSVIVENDHLVTKPLQTLPEVQENVDFVPAMMAANPYGYQGFNPYYRSYARMPVQVYPQTYFMPSYYGPNTDDIRFLHYMNSVPTAYNRPFFSFV